MRPKRPTRPPAPPAPPPAVVTPENLDAINTPEVDKIPAYISVGKFQWKPPLPGPKGDPGAPGAKGEPGEPGATARPITPPIAADEIGDAQVTTPKIADRSVDWAKIALSSINHELLYNIAPPTEGQILSFDSATAKFKWIDAPAPGLKMKTGQYTGTYFTDYAVTGIGFQPKVVFIYLREFYNGGPFVKTDQDGAFAGWFSWPGPNWGYSADIIKSLDADGFTVAASSPANGLQNYNYIAFG